MSGLSHVISGVPQGTVLGPILFLLHVADIARGVSEGNVTSSYVDDTRSGRCISDPSVECAALQEDLNTIYSWAEDVNMVFNSDKFESLGFWPDKDKKPSSQYLSPDGQEIEEKEHLRDLGVELSNDLSFSLHIENTVAGANKLVGWALRSFRRRSKYVMLTIWKSTIQSKMDYCSQLWSPNDQGSIARLESVARNFTSQIAGLEGKDYWERLKYLKLYSQEKHRERYQIIFLWKVVQGLVQGYHVEFDSSDRRGRVAVVRPYKTRSPAQVRRAREASLSVKGARLFNSIHRELRDMSHGKVESFKSGLVKWLSQIHDQLTIPNCQRAAVTNSLL